MNQAQITSANTTAGHETYQAAVQSQHSTKAIKKKSLLNFRAIKNNYVVKPTNTGMSMVENDLQTTQAKQGYIANSAMASNHASGSSAHRRNQHHGKIRASHS